jgi:hypothetical protein
MDFHNSLVQNFICGWGCCSIHWESSFEKRGWMAQRLDSYPEYQDELVRKWREKGFKLVPWKDRESCNWKSGSVYVMYLPGSGCGQAYISKNDLENEMVSKIANMAQRGVETE